MPEFHDPAPTVLELFEHPERGFQYIGIGLAGRSKRQWTAESIGLFDKMAVTRSRGIRLTR